MVASLVLALYLAQGAPEVKLATLEGLVTHAASKTPIRKAKVNLTGIGTTGGGSAETGDDGRFSLKDIKPGRYRLTAEKTGYETSAYGAKQPGETLGQIVRVDSGATLSSLDIALPKHGVIAGKVFDTDNEPLQKALVMALANVYNEGKRIRLPRGAVPVLTNDLGEYRVGQLPPGKYIICAIRFHWLQPNPDQKIPKPQVEDSMVTTCYPSAGNMDEAAAITIADGSEIPGIDMRMGKARTVSVEGRITGIPPGGGAVSILNLNAKTAGPMGNALNPRAFLMGGEGKFLFKNVPPGSYILHTLPTGLGNAPFVVKTPIDIGDQPIAGLEIPALIPFEIKAKIEAEPGPELKLGSIRVVLTAVDGITSALPMGTADADGNLALANLVPGKHKVNLTGVPSTHYVKEVRVGDRLVPGDEAEITTPQTPLAIKLVAGKAEINGLARNEKGEPVPGARVCLVPRPRRPFVQKITVSDQNGVFKLANLAPGEYAVLALANLEPGAQSLDLTLLVPPPR